MAYSVVEIVAGAPAAKARYKAVLAEWNEKIAGFLDAHGITEKVMEEWRGNFPIDKTCDAHRFFMELRLETNRKVDSALLAVYPREGFALSGVAFPDSQALSLALMNMRGPGVFVHDAAIFSAGEAGTFYRMNLGAKGIRVEKNYRRDPKGLVERVTALFSIDNKIMVREPAAYIP